MKSCSFALFLLLILMERPREFAAIDTCFQFSAFSLLLCWLNLIYMIKPGNAFCFSSRQYLSPAAPCWKFCSLFNRKEYSPTPAWSALLMSTKDVKQKVEVLISSTFFLKSKINYIGGVKYALGNFFKSHTLDKLPHLILITNFHRVCKTC